MKIVLIALIVVVLVALSALVSLKGRPGTGAKAGLYYLRKSLLSPAERSFLGVLDPSLPPSVRVFSKVRLEDIIGVKRGLSASERQGARNRINRRHVDFLLVRGTDLAPLAGIELDDSSHEDEDRQQRDAFVDAAFASAGLPLLHVPAQKSYNPSEIRAQLANLLNQNSAEASRS